MQDRQDRSLQSGRTSGDYCKPRRRRFPSYRNVAVSCSACWRWLPWPAARARPQGSSSRLTRPNIQTDNTPPLAKTIPIAMPTFHLYTGTLPNLRLLSVPTRRCS